MALSLPTHGQAAWDTPGLNEWLYVSHNADGTLKRFTNEWNAIEHGVVGDGVTDDTAAIQAFLIAADAAGATAYFPSRKYVSSTMTANIIPRIRADWGARI